MADPSALKELINLVHLDLGGNKIKNMNIFVAEESMVNLKYLDLNNNKLPELGAFKMPKLEYLDISGNKIEKVNEGWNGHATLRILKSVDNKFKNMAPFKNMPKLEELYLASNVIAGLEGYADLPALRKLHLRRNKITKILSGAEGEEPTPLAELPALEYLNLRSNQLPNMDHL